MRSMSGWLYFPSATAVLFLCVTGLSWTMPGSTASALVTVQGGQSGAPQSTRQSSGSGGVIKVNVGSVLLNVSVLDRTTRRSVAGLKKDDFVVYEDGVRQQVDQLLPAEAPFSLLLMLDVSGSTESYLKLMKEAAIEFTSDIKKNDAVAVATFNSKVKLAQDFTNDRAAAQHAIKNIHSGGGTALYDALMTGINDYVGRREGRKAIVLFTDGVDNQLTGDWRDGSKTSFDELYRRVQETDALIYIVFLDTEGQVPRQPGPSSPYPGNRRSPFPLPLPFPLPSPFPTPSPIPHPRGGDDSVAYETARQQLDQIAEQTGGRLYTPHEAEDLWQAYSQIADDLSIQYQVSYTSTDQSLDDRWRTIKVEVPGYPNAVVRTRKGYYAAKAD